MADLPCPRAELHTPQPTGYIAWHAWADAMAKTHHQEQCPGCGRWRIWIEGDPLDPDDTKGEAVTTRTRTRYDVYDMTEGSILVRGTLDPTEALRVAVEENSYITDHWVHAYKAGAPEDIRCLGDRFLHMLQVAKPGLYRRNPVGKGTWMADEGWTWQLGHAKAKGPGTFEGVLFP